MTRKLLSIMAIPIAFFIFSKPAQAEIYVSGSSAMLKDEVFAITKMKNNNPRIEKLKAFLIKHQSPLAAYTQELIKAAEIYQLDWKLLPAISGVESTFGKRIPPGSYNAYGWNNGNRYFVSWEDSINQVSQALREKYVNRGLDTPYKMGPIYAPPSPTWATKVVYFMEQIESFNEKNFLGTPNLTL